MYYFLITLIVTLFAGACSRHSAVSDTLAHAEAVMEEHPDSALAILEAIHDSTLTTRADRALHALLLSQALDKNYIDITSDSLINIAVDYYRNHGDRHEMLAHYYLGKVHFHNNNSQQATFEALKSISIAKKLNEEDYIGRGYDLAADIAHYNYNSDKSIDYRKEAIKYFHANERQKRSELFANLDLALAYENKHEYLISINILDSLRRIIEPDDSVLHALIVRALISPYYYSGELDEAQLCYDRLVNEYSSVVPPSSSDYIIGEKIALHKNNGYSTFSSDFIDSVVPDSINPSKMYFLANVYEKSGRYTESIKEFKKIVEFQDSVIANISKNSIDLGERDYFKAESDYYNNKSHEEQQKSSELLRWIFVVIVGCSVIVVVTIVIFRLKMRLRKEEIENKAKDIILLSDELQSLKTKSEKWDNIINKVYSEPLDRLLATTSEFLNNRESVASMKAYSHNMEKELDRLYDPKFLKSAEKEIDSARDNMVARLRESGVFNDEEIGLFVLLVLNLSPRSIAIITKNNIKTVYRRKRRIREKLLSSGIERKDEYITFLS